MAAILPFLPAIIGAVGSIGSAYLSSKGNKETKNQKNQRELVDQLMQSLQGNGPYSDLFNADEATFQKSFAEPAMNRFKNQTVPAIQQSYVSGQYGQQRGGTNMEDALARAGVNMQDNLDQQYYKFQQDAQDRQQDVIGKILGQNAGASGPQSTGDIFAQGAGEFLSNYPGTSQGKQDISGILNYFKQSSPQSPNRIGFVPDDTSGTFSQFLNPNSGV